MSTANTLTGGFENDVKTYGTETGDIPQRVVNSFENDVKTYGTETGDTFTTGEVSLRMM